MGDGVDLKQMQRVRGMIERLEEASAETARVYGSLWEQHQLRILLRFKFGVAADQSVPALTFPG